MQEKALFGTILEWDSIRADTRPLLTVWPLFDDPIHEPELTAAKQSDTLDGIMFYDQKSRNPTRGKVGEYFVDFGRELTKEKEEDEVKLLFIKHHW